MARIGLRSALFVVAAAVATAGVAIVVDAPGGVGSLFASPQPDERADQVLAGLAAEAPYLALLRERRPEVYAALRATLAEAHANGHTVMQMAAQGRRALSDWLAEAIATAPDAVALEMLAVTRGQFRELLASNPALCATMARGDAGDDSAPFLTPELLLREQAALELLLTAQPDATVVSLPEAEIEAAYRQITPELQARFGAALEADIGEVEDPATICAIQAATLDAFASLEPSRAAALARAVLGGS